LADRGDHAIVFEFGATADCERQEHSVHTGGTFAFEVTPVENILDLEIGITALAANGGIEMPVDVLFKKPWRPLRRFEFMLGAGLEIVHASGTDRATFWGMIAASPLR
jgi:hypothetical protein